MKIYNEIILKWNDVTKQYDTLYEDSYEHTGRVDYAQKAKDDDESKEQLKFKKAAVKAKQEIKEASGLVKDMEKDLSKAALNMMMKVYAIENPKTHFLSLSPGPVNTSMQDFICEELDGEKFEWKKKFVELRENNEAPSAEEAAEKIYELLPQLKEELESGSFIDVRKI